MNNQERKEALQRTHAWWYCDNIIDHAGQVGLLHMGFPRIFILMRDYDTAYWAGFDMWKQSLIEVTFMEKSDKVSTSSAELDKLLVDAWNFLALEEEEEEYQAGLAEADEDF